MKRQFIFAILAVLGFAVFGIGCQDDLARITKVVNEGAVVEQTRATALSNIIDLSRNEHPDYGVCFSESDYPTVDDDKISLGSIKDRKPYETILRRLKLGREYHYRPYVFDDDEPIYGDIEKVTINSIEGVTSTVNEIDITGFSSANVLAGVSGLGSLLGIDAGICYTIDTIPTIDDAVASIGEIHSDTVFSTELVGLDAFANYQVRTYCKLDSSTVVYSQPANFNISAPSIQTVGYTFNSIGSINVEGNLVSTGIYGVSDYGVCWATSEDPTINDFTTSYGQASNPNTFTVQNIQLNEGSTYHFRAYATSVGETYYGQTITILAIPPNVQTLPVESSAISGAILMTGEITSYYAVERGFCWSTSATNPTINDDFIVIPPLFNSNGASAEFFHALSVDEIEPNEEYSIRSYVKVGSDLIYGNVVNFNADVYDVQLLSFGFDSTLEVYNNRLQGRSIGLRGYASITEGYFPTEEVGFCLSSQHTPTISDFTISTEGNYFNETFTDSLGYETNFITNISSCGSAIPQLEITSGEVYYVRAYAKTAGLTQYSNELSFIAHLPHYELWSTLPTQRRDRSSFSLNDKGYVVGGYHFEQGQLNYATDVWEYSPSSQTWQQKAEFPGTPRSAGITFTIGDYAYLFGGRADGTDLYDLWRYSPSQNEWVELTGNPAISGPSNNNRGTAFVNGEEAFLLFGEGPNEFWRYSVVLDEWALMQSVQSSMPGVSEFSEAESIVHSSEAIIFTNNPNQAFKFNFISGTWAQLSTPPTAGVSNGVKACFRLNGSIFFISDATQETRLYYPQSDSYLGFVCDYLDVVCSSSLAAYNQPLFVIDDKAYFSDFFANNAWTTPLIFSAN
jgi:hypothetical protein